jgi:hypothetical protein
MEGEIKMGRSFLLFTTQLLSRNVEQTQFYFDQ